MEYIFGCMIDGQNLMYRSESKELTRMVRDKLESLGYVVTECYPAKTFSPKTDGDALVQSKILRTVFNMKRNQK